MYFSLPFSNLESIIDKDYIIARYLLNAIDEKSVLKRLADFAIGQSIGTWLPVPGITQEMIEDYQARVLSLFEIQSNHEVSPSYVFDIAFPMKNFNNSFSMIMTGLVGNDVSTSLKIKLVDVNFTTKALNRFDGPNHGVSGIRSSTGVYNRPVILNMLKPCLGMKPEDAAKLFYEVGIGGVDIVKDDEVLSSIPVSNVIDRIRFFKLAAKRIFEETGRKVLYIPNITDLPTRMFENAKKAMEIGCDGVMINFIPTGLDALMDISTNFGKDMIIMGHYAGVGIMQSSWSGITPEVIIGTLPRLAGADMIMTMYPKSREGIEYLEFLKVLQKQSLPMGKIKPTFITVGGGLTPLNVDNVIKETGMDVILGVGGAIQGHPMGPRAGAIAISRAVDSSIHGISIEEAARESRELQVAIETWS
jgi:2,3-diketo-5-methylthiopentyl-1-phosphate enolase